MAKEYGEFERFDPDGSGPVGRKSVGAAAVCPQIESRTNGTWLIRPQCQLKTQQSQSGHMAKATIEVPVVSTALQTGLVTLSIRSYTIIRLCSC